ncbi:hypothetical protein [Pseudaestuariivita atlantica]|nr:hypothetical protein [Pseudaestuariivita atlantica]
MQAAWTRLGDAVPLTTAERQSLARILATDTGADVMAARVQGFLGRFVRCDETKEMDWVQLARAVLHRD